jgi:serine/threonine-protein kinase
MSSQPAFRGPSLEKQMSAAPRTPTPPRSETSQGSPETPAFPGLSAVEPLESGGMGSVYRAWQDELARPVAVKTLRADLRVTAQLRELFQREAHILARLDHPGIVPVHDAGETECGPYYVMRLVEGVSVDRALAGKPAAEVAEVFRRIAEALATAHRAGVLHRDLKPANVLVEPPGRAVLVDFGLSTRMLPGEVQGAGEELVGTPDYLAPELLAGQSYSPASDIYALGATLYTTLTGQVPFPASELSLKLRAIREDDPPLPRTLRADVPKPLQAICLKAMERAPADRYASADELARDLGRFEKGDVVQALPVRSRSLLRRKIELQLAEHGDWLEQGLIDERQRSVLQHAYEHIDEEGRGLLRGVLGSMPNLLLLVGILLSVFGPLLLQLITWEQMSAPNRIGLPLAPLALLAALGVWRWRADDRRRAVACLFGASLLVAPFAFALADLVPALQAVADETGKLHPVLPGEMWLPPDSASSWLRAGAPLLEWKLLITAGACLAAALLLYQRLRAAAFLWIACFAGLLASVCGALVLGWQQLPHLAQWSIALLGALATLGTGLSLDRRFLRDRAQPFYGLGFIAAISVVLAFIDEGQPFSELGTLGREAASSWSAATHGLLFVTGGILMHTRGTPLLRQTAGAPLLVGFLLVMASLLTQDKAHGAVFFELLLVATCVGFLLLGLAMHRNSVVLPAAILLPISVGIVSQRHVQAIWAWSAAVVIGGAVLVLLSFRISARRTESPATRPSR